MASSLPSTIATFPSALHRRQPLSFRSSFSCLHVTSRTHCRRRSALRAKTPRLSGSIFEEDIDDDLVVAEGEYEEGDEEEVEEEVEDEEERYDDGIPRFVPSASWLAASMDVEKETPPCPPGLRQYETMAILRPDVSEDERLAITQKYEELLVAGGGMYVEMYNRGVIPLAYPIKRKNKDGETNTYMDGIYLLFTYFTKAESMPKLESKLKNDEDVIRSTSFKKRKRKY